MSIEFEVLGNQYRADKLSAFAQFHVSRRIAPLLPALVPVFLKIVKDGGINKDLSGLAELMQPFADGLAELSDEASEFVIATCLSVVKRRNGDTWASVWSSSGKCLMFDDLDLSSMLPIVIKVIQDSLGPFIRGFVTSQMTPAS